MHSIVHIVLHLLLPYSDISRSYSAVEENDFGFIL